MDDHQADDYIDGVLQAVIDWRAEAPSVVSQATSFISAPVGWLVSKVIPNVAIHGLLAGVDWMAKNILSAPASPDPNDLRACDRGADQVQNFHIGLAVVAGGGVGAAGLPGIAADIPIVLTLALRLIRQIGVEYGYSEDNETERKFCLAVLAAASANTVAAKSASHLVLQKISVILVKETWKSMVAKAVATPVGVEAGIIAVKQLAKELGVNLTKRKALQAIPLVGAAIGAASNGWFLRDIGLTAQRAFQERWLIERGYLIVNDGLNEHDDPGHDVQPV